MTETEQWHRICALVDIADGGKIGKQIRDHALLIIRVGNDIFCYEDRCPHAGAPLVDGRLAQGRLTCRHHQWQFDIRTGKSIRPSGHKIKSYSVKIEHEDIFVQLGLNIK